MTPPKNLTQKQIPYIIILLLAISLTTASTLPDLINTYDLDYSNGTINITSQNDNMHDKNSNGIDDTLIITLTTNAYTGTYNIFIEISDDKNTITNSTTKTFTAGDNTAYITYDTTLLSQPRFNYTTTITDIENNLIYRKHKTQTNTYSEYEKGTNIIGYSDENINNNLLRITLTINSTQTATKNITTVLHYNTSTITATKEHSLTTGTQTISIDIDNETIKSTHHNSEFTLTSVTLGNKQFNTNYTTKTYNYEDFAKTSYIKSYTASLIDINSFRVFRSQLYN